MWLAIYVKVPNTTTAAEQLNGGEQRDQIHSIKLSPILLRTVFGAAVAIFSNAFAAPLGSRRPYSQSCSVRTDTKNGVIYSTLKPL